MIKPKAILFDFSDTVLHEICFTPKSDDEYFLSISENPNNVTINELEEYANILDTETYGIRNNSCLELPWKSFNRLIYEKFQIKVPNNIYAELEFWKHSEKYSIAPGIEDLLKFTKENEIKVGIVSNNIFSGSVIEWELEKFKINKYFEFVISSSDYGIRKPHPLLFKTAIAKLNNNVEEIWFAGDNYEYDILASRNVGMKAFYYIGSSNKCEYEDENTINDWNEMKEILTKVI
jgi:putative hydrolase of the HAD superfamily